MFLVTCGGVYIDFSYMRGYTLIPVLLLHSFAFCRFSPRGTLMARHSHSTGVMRRGTSVHPLMCSRVMWAPLKTVRGSPSMCTISTVMESSTSLRPPTATMARGPCGRLRCVFKRSISFLFTLSQEFVYPFVFFLHDALREFE